MEQPCPEQGMGPSGQPFGVDGSMLARPASRVGGASA
jgi:hypothetical protein